jgi:hypothetical protein
MLIVENGAYLLIVFSQSRRPGSTWWGEYVLSLLDRFCTRFSGPMADTPRTEEETRLSLCRSCDGFAFRSQSERSGCRLRTGSIQKLAQQGSGLFPRWNVAVAYRLFLQEGRLTCSAVE